MEIKEMQMSDIEARSLEIEELMKAEDADIEALTKEVEELEARKAEIETEVEKRKKEAEEALKTATEIEKVEERKMTDIEVRNSKEYINAFAEYLKNGEDAECRSLLTENASGTIPVPEMVYEIVKTAWNREGIMARVKKAYIKGNLKVGFEISATGATVHTEGQQVSEETLVLGTVQILPKAIKKIVRISDEALDLTGSYFLEYLYDELTYQIAKKAAEELISLIKAAGTASTTTAVAVPAITVTTVGMDTIAQAVAQLSDDAANPVVMMNKLTWAEFKKVQYANGYGADPFEGLPVEFNNTIVAYSAATTGVPYVIVGDLEQGAIANFPNGEEITFKYDDLTDADYDLVRIIGREFVGLGIVAPNAFVKVTK